MRELHSEAIIDAPAERVWQVLVAFEDYPAWNPFIRSAAGTLEEGERIRVTIGTPRQRAMTFKPRLLVVRPPRELRWLGRVGLPRLFDGEHSFVIEPLGAHRSRVVQHERFHGLLVPLMKRSRYDESQRGFDDLMAALKRRAEGPRVITEGSSWGRRRRCRSGLRP